MVRKLSLRQSPLTGVALKALNSKRHEAVLIAWRYTLRMATADEQASDLSVDIQLADKAFAEVRDHGTWLVESEPHNSWFAPLLVQLIQSALREYQHLKIGYAKSIPFLAWACRNMLELDIITQHVLKSEKDAKDFIDDRFTDGLEFFESFKTWSEFADPGFKSPELDQTIAWIRGEISKEGVTRRSYLKVRDLAKGLKLAEEYAHLNKVTSKLIHPTAWSVLSMRDEGELSMLRPICFHAGVRHGIELGYRIRQHVKEFGPEPRP